MWHDRIAKQRPATAAEKEAIIQGAREVLRDPYSVRDAEISGFIPMTPTSGEICVRVNAKNAMGAYTGRKSWFISMRNNVILGAWEGHISCDTPGIVYKPFPELYRLRNI